MVFASNPTGFLQNLVKDNLNPLVTKNVLGELILDEVLNSVKDIFALYVVREFKFGQDWHKSFGFYLFQNCHSDTEYFYIGPPPSGPDHQIKLNSKTKVFPTHIEIIEKNARIKIEFLKADLISLDQFSP
jgi:hypothetical protein